MQATLIDILHEVVHSVFSFPSCPAVLCTILMQRITFTLYNHKFVMDFKNTCCILEDCHIELGLCCFVPALLVKVGGVVRNRELGWIWKRWRIVGDSHRRSRWSVEGGGSQALAASGSPGRLVQTQIRSPLPVFSFQLGRSGWGLRICLSKEFSGSADAAGLGLVCGEPVVGRHLEMSDWSESGGRDRAGGQLGVLGIQELGGAREGGSIRGRQTQVPVAEM